MMSRRSVWAPLVFVLGGCTTTIEGPDGHLDPDHGAGSAGTGSVGAGATGGTGASATGGVGGTSAAGAGPVTGGQAGTTTGQGGASSGGTAGAAALPAIVLDAGRVVLRRLNRSEYNNTVRDLLGTSLRPADQLPNDETVDGFDTVGEGLGLTLQHFEVLEQSATTLIDELFILPAGDPRRTSVLLCDVATGSEACARQILTAFARRAFRRPPAEVEILSLLALLQRAVDAGNSQEEALKAALRAVLLSPHFLYMVERTGAPGGNGASPIDDHELATRLSYFLWSSMPDAELSAAADAGTLVSDGAALDLAATRMLADQRAAALTDNFVGQWLTLRRLVFFEPSMTTFPSYRPELRDAAVEETERFVRALIDENAPVEALLTASFTFVNDALASHYELSPQGPGFQRVELSGAPRVGLLGQMSFLGQTSHPSHTSPTKRGAWVLEQLLCSPPEPPPADLMIEPLGEPVPGQTVRERLEEHRANPSCAGCHAILDPIGFGLENFDAVGAYRTEENGAPVDATGTIDDVTFSGALELATLLAADPRFAACTTQQLLTYAVGRPFHTPEAQAYAAALVAHARAEGRAGFADLITTVVRSEAFRTRRGE